MKKGILYLLSICVLLGGCAKKDSSDPTPDSQTEVITSQQIKEASEVETAEKNEIVDTSEAEKVLRQYLKEDDPDNFYSLDDPDLHQYLEDTIYSDLVSQYETEDFIIENVNTVYVSKEYIEELEYNSKENVFFGYTLSELDAQFQGKKYIFTLGENGETEVKVFEGYSDDTYSKSLKNVAIGSGVILVCVTVSVVSGGVGAAPISMVFAASAKTGATMALSAGAFSSIFCGTVTAIKTGDIDEALKAAALGGSESFKWAAIAGALIGGASEASALYAANSSTGVTAVSQNIPEWRQAELRALDRYGGREQISYLNGVEVPKGTPGATRPDILCDVGGHLEAIEVKYYDLSKTANLDVMYSELEREIAARAANLPAGTTQKIVLDVTGRGFTEEMVNAVTEIVQGKLYGIYPNIPIEIWGL